MILRSKLLPPGLRHGFATRTGGVSEGPFSSLNLVAKWGDDPARVAENQRRLGAAAGFDPARLFVARQVHGAQVHEVTAEERPNEVATIEADALVTRVAGHTLAVSTADCTPILLHSEGVIAAAHAGWRGTVAGIAAQTVAAMGVPPAQVRAVVGPCICVRCFEVGDEVAAQFDAAHVRRDLGPKPHVDLQAANAAALRAAAVGAVEVIEACSVHEPERFFSYRRDAGKTGGHLSFIAL